MSAAVGKFVNREIKDNVIMIAYIADWADLLLRWLHIITGIAWIGSSFYFIWLDLSLRRRQSLPQGVHGESWSVHGGATKYFCT